MYFNEMSVYMYIIVYRMVDSCGKQVFMQIQLWRLWFSFQKYFLDAKYFFFSFLLPLQLLLYYGPKYSVRMPHKADKSQAICNLYQTLQRRHNKKDRDGVSNHQPHDFYSTVYSGTDQRKHQSSASLAFVWGIHRWIPRTNGHLRRKCFHSMTSLCLICHPCCIQITCLFW